MNVIKQVSVPFEIGQGMFQLETANTQTSLKILKVSIDPFDCSQLNIQLAVTATNTIWRGHTNRMLEVRYLVVKKGEEFNTDKHSQIIPFNNHPVVNTDELFFVLLNWF